MFGRRKPLSPSTCLPVGYKRKPRIVLPWESVQSAGAKLVVAYRVRHKLGRYAHLG